MLLSMAFVGRYIVPREAGNWDAIGDDCCVLCFNSTASSGFVSCYWSVAFYRFDKSFVCFVGSVRWLRSASHFPDLKIKFPYSNTRTNQRGGGAPLTHIIFRYVVDPPCCYVVFYDRNVIFQSLGRGKQRGSWGIIHNPFIYSRFHTPLSMLVENLLVASWHITVCLRSTYRSQISLSNQTSKRLFWP